MAENWADLLPELLELCSKRLRLLEEWFAFRSVCSTWHAAAFQERFDIPWLMLAEDQRTETGCAEFYSLFSSRTHKVVLPEVKGKRCLSSLGWLFTVGKDFQVHMLNPLSRAAGCRRNDMIQLPGLDKLPRWDPDLLIPEHMYADFVDKFVLSANPASSPNYSLMAMYTPFGHLALWKPGNEEWKNFNRWYDPVLDVIYYKGQFLAVNQEGHILAYDVDGADPTAQLLMETRPQIPKEDDFTQLYLVESVDRLFLVSRWGQQDRLWGEDVQTIDFTVFAVDLDAQKVTKVKSFGNTSLFIGYNSSFSVEVDESQHPIRPNRIYFTDDFSFLYRPSKDGGGKDMGIYRMEDGIFESFYDGKSCHHFSPPIWVQPSL